MTTLLPPAVVRQQARALARNGRCVCGMPIREHYDRNNRFLMCRPQRDPTVGQDQVSVERQLRVAALQKGGRR